MIPNLPDLQCPVCRKTCADRSKCDYRWAWQPCDQMIRAGRVGIGYCPDCAKAGEEESRKRNAEQST